MSLGRIFPPRSRPTTRPNAISRSISISRFANRSAGSADAPPSSPATTTRAGTTLPIWSVKWRRWLPGSIRAAKPSSSISGAARPPSCGPTTSAAWGRSFTGTSPSRPISKRAWRSIRAGSLATTWWPCGRSDSIGRRWGCRISTQTCRRRCTGSSRGR